MTSAAKARTLMKVEILENGEPTGQKITVGGRSAWALDHLMRAGEKGCTPITHPGPRWAHYVFCLRRAGVTITTEHEPHAGEFPGTHARYRLGSEIRVIEGKAA